MNPRISIIVPVYNVEKYIDECINSIIDQSFKDFELLLIDDGSTDRSGIICDDYSFKDPRIIVIHKENGGQSLARNIGLDNATGDYIGFIDSDDWIHKDMYKLLYDRAIEFDADITACNILSINRDNTQIIFCSDPSDYLYDRDSAEKELSLNERFTFSPCNKLYKKCLFKNTRFKEGIIFEDEDLLYKIIHQSNIVYYTGIVYYYYRFNDESTTRKPFTLKRIDHFKVKQDMYNFYRENYPQYADEVYAELYLTGLVLFINVQKYYRPKKGQYTYLIDTNRTILKSLLFKKGYNKKKKILIGLGMISTFILVQVYSFYLDKIRKVL